MKTLVFLANKMDGAPASYSPRTASAPGGRAACMLVLVVRAVALVGRLQPPPIVTPPPIAVATPSANEPTASTDPAGTATTAPATSCHIVAVALPDPVCTPGATNPNVSQSNIGQTIYVSGCTRTIRPPVSYTDPLKRQQIALYGLGGTTADYEEDHLIPLELGGPSRLVGHAFVQQSAQQLGRNRAVQRGTARVYTCGKVASRACLTAIRKPPVGSSSLPVGSVFLRELTRFRHGDSRPSGVVQQSCSNWASHWAAVVSSWGRPSIRH